MSGGIGILLSDSFLAGRSGGFGTAAFAFFAVISACSIFLSPVVAGMSASVFFGGGAVAVASCLPECRLFVAGGSFNFVAALSCSSFSFEKSGGPLVFLEPDADEDCPSCRSSCSLSRHLLRRDPLLFQTFHSMDNFHGN